MKFPMLNEDNKALIVKVIDQEATRIQYGKVLIEATIANGQVTNISLETKRSININR